MIEWDGERLDHPQMVRELESWDVKRQQKNGVDGVMLRLVNLEAERMIRLGEQLQNRSFLNVESITKAKPFKPGSKSAEVSFDIAQNFVCCIKRFYVACAVYMWILLA
jgi:hypothetical protein